ncbi:MAG: hypothetical protein M1272_01740 [Firmicutes bacterium]|nr:hypothetical protein [Bacillota bacterium]
MRSNEVQRIARLIMTRLSLWNPSRGARAIPAAIPSGGALAAVRLPDPEDRAMESPRLRLHIVRPPKPGGPRAGDPAAGPHPANLPLLNHRRPPAILMGACRIWIL